LDFIPAIVDHDCMTTADTAIVLRRAVPADAAALGRLATLDSRRLPAGPHLVAERDGVPIAALALPSGIAFSDPFTPTADALELLRRWGQSGEVLAPIAKPTTLIARWITATIANATSAVSTGRT
jgi:hypothetical protein